jgi:gas vesicle protein
MFSRVRIAIRFFFVGLAVGVLLAPRSGEQTRRLVREKADRLLNDILDAATLGTAQTGGDVGDTDAEAAAPAPATRTPRSRSGNGSRKSSSSTTEATAATTPAS